MKFGYTIIYVDAVPASLAFYRDAFGFETRFLHASEQYGELETGETVLAFASHSLGEMHFGEVAATARSQSPSFAIEIAFVDDDVRSAFARAIAAGATAIAEPAEKPWGQTVAYVRTPDGTLVELCSPMHP